MKTIISSEKISPDDPRILWPIYFIGPRGSINTYINPDTSYRNKEEFDLGAWNKGRYKLFLEKSSPTLPKKTRLKFLQH